MSSPPLRLEVPSEAAGERLDRWLASALPEASRSRLARLISEGLTRVDGRAARASQRLRGGEVITCDVAEPAPGRLVAEERELAVLHEDEDLLVIDKPAGLVMHPGAGALTGTLAHALLHHCGPSLRAIGGEGRPGIVHRLDKGTSGVLVVARTQRAYASLTAQFAARTVTKIYLAIVSGGPAETGRVDAPIARSPARRTRMAIRAAGRPALSEWRVIERFGASAAVVEVRLHTGRTHQARVHLAHAGHGIIGDAAYRSGGPVPEPWARDILASAARPSLHAFRLEIDHPATGARCTFEAPLPEDLRLLLVALRDRAP